MDMLVIIIHKYIVLYFNDSINLINLSVKESYIFMVCDMSVSVMFPKSFTTRAVFIYVQNMQYKSTLLLQIDPIF